VVSQLTDHVIVAVTVNAESFASPSALGCPADDSAYVYEQSVDCAVDGRAVWYGVPGPGQRTVCPSPIDQETNWGTAVAVALTAPAVAVARKLCQVCGETQSHDVRLTTLNAAGLRLMTGLGSVRRPTA